jgi:hypothetical protein
MKCSNFNIYFPANHLPITGFGVIIGESRHFQILIAGRNMFWACCDLFVVKPFKAM